MATGILVVDKPPQWTSHDVVAKLRGVFQEKRIGHAGTLDPMATGVLPVFLGRATRVVEFATESDKEYLAELTLGIRTDTQDSTGTVLYSQSKTASPLDLEGILPEFRGEIQQIPPMYSAIKIKGKKLYELARKGMEVERAPRTITISRLEIVKNLPIVEENGELRSLSLDIACSKGTYVRTICHDIGERLACGGMMSSLRRTKAAGYDLSQSHSLDAILHHPDPKSLLLPVDSFFQQPECIIQDKQVKKLRNGSDFDLSPEQNLADGDYRIYDENHTFLALSSITKGQVHTIKSFFEVYQS